MGLQGKNTAEWFARGKAALVNGVSSGFRYWGDDDTLVIDHGEGAYVFDMDGNRYIDYQMGFGPVILGHGEPTVAAAVAEAAVRDGRIFMTDAPSALVSELAAQDIPVLLGRRRVDADADEESYRTGADLEPAIRLVVAYVANHRRSTLIKRFLALHPKGAASITIMAGRAPLVRTKSPTESS